MPPPATSLTGLPDCDDYETGDSDQFDQLARQEIEKCRANQLKKKWNEYNEEKTRLDAEKEEHIREVRRLREEENSKYCQRPVLNVGKGKGKGNENGNGNGNGSLMIMYV